MAFAVDDLERTRIFYRDVLGAKVGREAERWIDFDFFGHQLSAHLAVRRPAAHNPVDGDQVPVPHFGVILEWDAFEALAAKLHGHAFLIGPRVRFAGQPGEQATMFITDPAGNALEFKAFRDDASVFATQ